MKIFYDYQIFENQVYGGISRYFYEIIKGLEVSADVTYMLPLIRSSNHYIKKIPTIEKGIKSGSDYYKQFMYGSEFPGKWMLYQQWTKLFPRLTSRNQRLTIDRIKQGDFDIFHPTDINDYFLDHIGNRPFVITIHDMIDEYFPEYSFHVYSTYKTSVKERLVKQAAGIITVSESTKRDLLHRFDVDEKKIKVIHHGVSLLGPVPKDNLAPIVTGDYLLYVGKRVHYKNFYFFLQCIQSILLKDSSLKIVCAGAPFNSGEIKYFNDLRIADNIVHQEADDRTLGSLYSHAKAFVYPSLYEGFGIPILEAFKYGCPVVLSHSSSFPEVAGDAGFYFNPKEIDSIRQAVLSVLNDTELRSQLIKRGFERLQNFSWEKALNDTISFYKGII